MIYNLFINANDGTPLKGAVVFTDSNGHEMASFPADNTGGVSINSDTDNGLFQQGVTVTFTAPGYNPYGLSAATLPDTFTAKLAKNNAILAVGIGILLAIVLLNKKALL